MSTPTYSATPVSTPVSMMPPQPTTTTTTTYQTYSAPSYGASPSHTTVVQPTTISGFAVPGSYTVSESNLYNPEGCVYVSGRSLRGGMTPLYNPAEVRTFEAPAAFKSGSYAGSPVVMERDVSSSSSSSGMKQARPVAKKRMCC